MHDDVVKLIVKDLCALQFFASTSEAMRRVAPPKISISGDQKLVGSPPLRHGLRHPGCTAHFSNPKPAALGDQLPFAKHVVSRVRSGNLSSSLPNEAMVPDLSRQSDVVAR
jgi:hypothetical protein